MKKSKDGIYFWSIAIFSLYAAIAFSVFSWQHPQWNDMQALKHLPEVLTFRMVANYEQR
jgi:hypothetical protein